MSVRRAVALVTSWLAAIAVLLGPAVLSPALVGASAHDQLVSVEPADGSSVEQAPPEVTLTFSAELIPVGTEVRVTGPDGVLTTAPAQVVAEKVIQELPDELVPGQYSLAWRVVSSDGHPISGTTRFTLAGSSPSQASATDTASAATTPAQTPSAPAATTQPTTTDEDSSAGSTAVWWFAAAGILAALAGLVVLRRRR